MLRGIQSSALSSRCRYPSIPLRGKGAIHTGTASALLLPQQPRRSIRRPAATTTTGFSLYTPATRVRSSPASSPWHPLLIPRCYSTAVTNPPPYTPPPSFTPNNPPTGDTNNSSTPPPPPNPPPLPTRTRRLLRIATTLFFITTGAYIIFLPQLHQRTHPPSPLHPTTFHPWIIVAREPCTDPTSGASARSAIFTLRPKHPPPEGTEQPEEQWADLWSRGVWSVEVKQPELMVSRRYTPLPELSRLLHPAHLPAAPGGVSWDTVLALNEAGVDGRGEDGGGDKSGELRFWIKEEQGGEVSRWLFGLPVGSEVGIRGPRWEWEFPWAGEHEEERKGRVLAFLAGGTGISPALQVGAALIEKQKRNPSSSPPPPPSSSSSSSSSSPAPPPPPPPHTTYNILLAARTPHDIPHPIIHELAILHTLAPHAGVDFSVTPHIDSRGEFITLADVERAVDSASSPSSPHSPPSSPHSSSSWTSWLPSFLPGVGAGGAAKNPPPSPPPEKVERRERDVAVAVDTRDRYILVSGPDGFITHFAGPKGADGESQGKVGGVAREVIGRGRAGERDLVGESGDGEGEGEGAGKRARWFIWKL